MVTHNEALRLTELLRRLAESVLAAAKPTIKGRKRWNAVLVDMRCEADGKSFNHKIRVEYRDGTLGSVRTPVDVATHLIALADSRPRGADRWYGMLFRVSPQGRCETQFNYDAHCAEDESFYQS
jgi:hypothetical protein